MDVYTITCFTAFLTFILGICSQTTDRPPPSVTSQFRATKLAVIGRYKAATLNGSISSVSAVAQNNSTSTRTLLPFEIEVSLREKPCRARPDPMQGPKYPSWWTTQVLDDIKGRGKIAAISQTTFSNAFSWIKMHEFHLKFHWSLFLMLELTIFQHWLR